PDGRAISRKEAMLARLAKKLRPSGKYAIGCARERDAAYVHIAFESANDANNLAKVVQATTALILYRGWVSQRTFLFGYSAAAVASQLVNPRGDQGDRPPLPCRRQPWRSSGPQAWPELLARCPLAS